MGIRHEMITGRWSLLIEDTHADEDAYLDEVPLTGKVIFTPVWPEGVVAAPAGGEDEPLRLVAAQPVTALVADGVLTDLQGREGQPLPVQIGGVELWWRARFDVGYHGIEVPLNPLLVDATDGPVELSTLISAKGYPDDDLSGLESIRATVRRQAREVAEALGLAQRAAADAQALMDRAETAIKNAEGYVRQVRDLVDETSGYRNSTAELHDEVEGWYKALSEDTKAIIDAVNGHVDTIAEKASTEADRAKEEADRAGAAAAAEVDRIKGDAPEAYDTLEEIAAWINDATDSAAGLVRSIAEKADKDHTHTIGQVDGLQDALDGRVETTGESNRLYGTNSAGNQTEVRYSSAPSGLTVAYRVSGGALAVGAPTGETHAAPRSYVDDAVSEARGHADSRMVVVDSEDEVGDEPGVLYLVKED